MITFFNWFSLYTRYYYYNHDVVPNKAAIQGFP